MVDVPLDRVDGPPLTGRKAGRLPVALDPAGVGSDGAERVPQPVQRGFLVSSSRAG